MLASARRPLIVLFTALTACCIAPTTASAVPTLTAADETVSVPASSANTVVLHIAADYDGNLAVELLTQPAHGAVELLDDRACTYPGGNSTCTITARYTAAVNYVGGDSFTYRTRDQADNTSPTATVAVTVTGSTPVIAGTSPTLLGVAWDGSASGLLPGATVSWGDSATAQELAAAAGSAPLDHRWLAAGTYTVTVTNHASNGTVAASRLVTVATDTSKPSIKGTTFQAAFVSSSPAAIPTSAGINPGLHVYVIDGSIVVTNTSATQSFSAGQFGFVPNFQTPPIVVPKNPGLQFTPPPSFTAVTTGTLQIGPGGSSATYAQKTGGVDCVVRSGGGGRTWAVEPPAAPTTSPITPPTNLAEVVKTDTLIINSASGTPIKEGSGQVTKKTYCNTASRSSHGFPGAHAAATTAINLVPELWYISAPGVASKVVSSSRPYAVSGVSALTDSVYATFDATSTPQLADLERETQFLVVTHPFVAPVNALTRPGAASVVGWPGRRASVRTGVRFTCPLGTRGTCVVRARLTSKQYGVTRTVGTSVIRVKPGRSAQVNVLLNASGRWRYANEGLVATLTVDAAAAVPKVRHATGSWGVRVRAPR